MNLHTNILSIIGNTPLVKINHLCSERDAEIWAKLEGYNPGGSVKDRIALSMVKEAEKNGKLKPKGIIIEPTSGNTGIGLALVGALKGYKVILTMPETMSIERRQLLMAFGAELILTEKDRGMVGAVKKASEVYTSLITNESTSVFMPHQFENPANPRIHRDTTALEIIQDLGCVPDCFISGVGTGGTITGIGEVFRSRKQEVWIAAVEPKSSPVLSGGKPGLHRIEGIGAGFLPKVLNIEIYDEVIQVSDEDAIEMSRQLSLKEGILAGISSGAALWAALRAAKKFGRGKRVVVILPDRGERYLSTGLFQVSKRE